MVEVVKEGPGQVFVDARGEGDEGNVGNNIPNQKICEIIRLSLAMEGRINCHSIK